MEHCFENARINSRTKASTSCKTVKISEVTSEFKNGVCGIFATTGQKNLAKIGISHEIFQQLLGRSLPNFQVGRGICVNYKTSIIYAVAQGTLL